MKYSDYSSYLLGLMRIVVAFLFMAHGTQKLFGFPSGEPINVDTITTLYGIAGILETVGGFFLMIGFLTRPFAFVLSGEMAVAYFKVHAPQEFWPLLNGGELAMLYCFIFLYISAVGPGKFSIDGTRGYE
ncbi:MAG: DoxX family protein [Ignavibacteriales bacterium]|nr:DoxX family protein [Ignavibacteriales bacterium]